MSAGARRGALRLARAERFATQKLATLHAKRARVGRAIQRAQQNAERHGMDPWQTQRTLSVGLSQCLCARLQAHTLELEHERRALDEALRRLHKRKLRFGAQKSFLLRQARRAQSRREQRDE